MYWHLVDSVVEFGTIYPRQLSYSMVFRELNNGVKNILKIDEGIICMIQM